MSPASDEDAVELTNLYFLSLRRASQSDDMGSLMIEGSVGLRKEHAAGRGKMAGGRKSPRSQKVLLIHLNRDRGRRRCLVETCHQAQTAHRGRELGPRGRVQPKYPPWDWDCVVLLCKRKRVHSSTVSSRVQFGLGNFREVVENRGLLSK